MSELTLLNQAPTDVFQPGWQYDIQNPLAAYRNKLAERGMRGSVFNQQWNALIDRAAAGSYAQYLASVLDKGTGITGSDYGDFLDRSISGQQSPLTMLQGRSVLARLGQVLSDVDQKIAAWSGGKNKALTPEARQALFQELVKNGTISETDAAIAGVLSDPRAQQQAYLSAFSPSLGPGLTSGLAKTMGAMSDVWDEGLGTIAGPSFTSLLDVLTGNRPKPAGPFAVGAVPGAPGPAAVLPGAAPSPPVSGSPLTGQVTPAVAPRMSSFGGHEVGAPPMVEPDFRTHPVITGPQPTGRVNQPSWIWLLDLLTGLQRMR